MSQLVQRATAADYEVLDRVVEGVALRFNRPSRVTDDGWKSSYSEGWRNGSLASAVERSDWGLRQTHRGEDVGTVAFTIDGSALRFQAHINEGDLGDKLIADIQSGEWGDVSLGAYVLRSTKEDVPEVGRVTWRLQAQMDHLAVARTGSGLVHGAEVQVLRATSATPRLDALRKKLILL